MEQHLSPAPCTLCPQNALVFEIVVYARTVSLPLSSPLQSLACVNRFCSMVAYLPLSTIRVCTTIGRSWLLLALRVDSILPYKILWTSDRQRPPCRQMPRYQQRRRRWCSPHAPQDACVHRVASPHAAHVHDRATATHAPGAWGTTTHPRQPGAAVMPMTLPWMGQAGGCARHPWHGDVQESLPTTDGALPMQSRRTPDAAVGGQH